MSRNHHIPSGWKRLSLHQVAEVQTGIAMGKTGIEDPVQCPYLRVANVQDGRLDLTQVKTILVTCKDRDRYRLQAGDVLMTEGGDFDKLGRGFVWEEQIPDCLHQNHVFAVRPKREMLSSYFLSYQTASSYGRNYFLSCSKQSTNLASINSSQLKEYPVLLPPRHEQDAIVDFIRKWDGGIALTEKLIAARQERRTWFMQQLLSGRRRLKDKPWRTIQLGDVFVNRVETGFAHLPLVAITGENGVVSRTDLARRDTSSEDKSRYLRICPGDIGYNTMRMWQGVCGLSSIEGIVSPAYTIITPKDEVDGEFMSLLFKFSPVVHLLHRHSQGLVDDTLNLKWRHFAEIKVNIPEKAEQQAIAAVFRTADNEINLLRAELNALREQKKGLMQQLMTGKVRVKVPPAQEIF